MTEAANESLDPRIRNQPELPDDVGGIIRVLEDQILEDASHLEAVTPDPLAPIAERVAHTIAYGRVKADSEVLTRLYEANKQNENPDSK